MSRTQKQVLIGLALFLVAFVALVIWGQTRPRCTAGRQACAKAYQPGGTMKSLGGLFARAGPKASLPQKRYELNAAGSIQVDVAPADDKIRTLKLRLVQGTVDLSFDGAPEPPGGAGKGDIDLSEQHEATALPREADDADEQRSLSFAVKRGGGQLTIACKTAPCVVTSAD